MGRTPSPATRRRRDKDRDRSERKKRRERVRSREREREKESRRQRSRSPRSRERSPERSSGRRRSRSRSRSREHRAHPSTSRGKPERHEFTEADLEGKSPEEIEMMKTMGFCTFDTTKNKKVDGNDVGEVHVILKRKYRQYMNRKGGFNRPLDFVA